MVIWLIWLYCVTAVAVSCGYRCNSPLISFMRMARLMLSGSDALLSRMMQNEYSNLFSSRCGYPMLRVPTEMEACLSADCCCWPFGDVDELS